MKGAVINPCSTGITFLTLIYLNKQKNYLCLNPCSTGITFLTIELRRVSVKVEQVLILVLLE